MEPLHGRGRAIFLRINAGKQRVRGRRAATHHAACLRPLHSHAGSPPNALVAAGLIGVTTTFAEGEKHEVLKRAQIRAFLPSAHKQSHILPEVEQRRRCQRSDAHRSEECHTDPTACSVGSARRFEQREQPVRTQRRSFHVRKTLPSFALLSCTVQTHAQGGETTVGGSLVEAGRRHRGCMWSCADPLLEN